MVQSEDEEDEQMAPGGPSALPSAEPSEADPFSDGDALDVEEEEDGEDLHEDGRAVPMGCVSHALANRAGCACCFGTARPRVIPAAHAPHLAHPIRSA